MIRKIENDEASYLFGIARRDDHKNSKNYQEKRIKDYVAFHVYENDKDIIAFSGMFPFQSIYLSYRTEEAMKAFENYGEGKPDSDRLLIPKNKRLNVKIIRGRG